jgi:predicted DNA-binding transcriptional regulator YafY
LHNACTEEQLVCFAYTREDGAESERTVQPLGLYFWGNRWTLVAWCRTRNDHRQFRLDRMRDVEVLEERFASKRGQRLADFLRKVHREAKANAAGPQPGSSMKA